MKLTFMSANNGVLVICLFTVNLRTSERLTPNVWSIIHSVVLIKAFYLKKLETKPKNLQSIPYPITFKKRNFFSENSDLLNKYLY